MLNFSFTPLAAWLAAGLALCALPAAWGQNAWPRIDPAPTASAANPASAVPTLVYSSGLSGSTGGIEKGRLDWKRVNEAVGQFPNGHADLLRLETAPQPAVQATDNKAKP